MTRTEFAEAVRHLLTDGQRAEIMRLHDQVEEAWDDGCAAHHEGADCCVDAMVGVERAEIRAVRHVEGCQCLVQDGAVLNVDLRCEVR